MKFKAPKQSGNITFRQKMPKVLHFSVCSLFPALPPSNTAIIIENMTNKKPNKSFRVYRENGTLRTKRIK